MNKRQRLKKLRQDNAIMHNIIKNFPEMDRLYNALYSAYSDPVNVVYTEASVRRYKYSTMISLPEYTYGWMEPYKLMLADGLLSGLRDLITYNAEADAGCGTMSAEILAGRVKDVG